MGENGGAESSGETGHFFTRPDNNAEEALKLARRSLAACPGAMAHRGLH